MLLLPAPAEIKDSTEILFYEVEPQEHPGGIDISGFDINHQKLSFASVRLDAGHKLSATIGEGAHPVRFAATLSRTPDGQVHIDAALNDQPVTITQGSSSSYAGAEVAAFDDATAGVLEQWQHLGDPLITLGYALRAQESTDTWGCTSCGLLGGGVAVAAFGCLKSAGAALPACAAAFIGGGTFVEMCEGACA